MAAVSFRDSKLSPLEWEMTDGKSLLPSLLLFKSMWGIWKPQLVRAASTGAGI